MFTILYHNNYISYLLYFRPGWALTIIIFPLKATRELIMAINLSPQAALHHCIKQCIITLRACARGNVIGLSVVCLSSVVSTKITRSGDLGIWANRKYNLPVDIIEKLVSLCFEPFGKVHERRKYYILLATPINTTHHVLSAHAHNLAQYYVGKGRQH